MKKTVIMLSVLALIITACPQPEPTPGGQTTTYTVSFDKNGGDTEASPRTKTVTPPATTIDALPGQPTRSGYSFTGWNAAANGSGAAFTTTTTVSANITVYAQWTAGSLPALGGTVAITGTAKVGQTLTADTTGLTGQSGTLHYAWKADNVSVGTDAATYTVRSNDIGKPITVTVTSTGNTGSVTSNPTVAVADGRIAYTGLAEHLATLDTNTEATPHTVALAPVDISGVWSDINTAVLGKYVILYLSDCTATDNTISGQYSPTSNDMNIIKDNQYIKGLILPDTLTSIGHYAFYYCTSLTSVIIPNSVNTIGHYAFSGCTSLTSVTIPGSVDTIGDGAFSSCSGLTSITVDAANANYAGEDGVLFNKTKTTLIQYPARKTGSYSIPSGVNTIGNYAFDQCTGLTSITIPNSVNTIGYYAFSGCYGLTSVTIPGSVNTIEGGAFEGCTSLTSVTFGTGSSISESNFGSDSPFPGDLRDKYLAGGGGAGTYTRPSGSDNTWTKQ